MAAAGEGEEMNRVKLNQTAAHSVVVTLASLPDFSATGRQQPLCLLFALCLSLPLSVHLPESCRLTCLFYFSEEAHSWYISYRYPPCCYATCEKVLACWQQPQEVSFPLKHNYLTVKPSQATDGPEIPQK